MKPSQIACLITLLPLAAGCRDWGKNPAPVAKPIINYATDPMEKVIDDINKNNSAIPTLWARHQIEMTLKDPKANKTTFVNGDGAILFKRPDGFRLTASKPGIGTLFEVGTTADYYWLTMKPEVDRMYYGQRKNLGKPCVQALPTQPELISEVLGVGAIDADFLKPPAPIMRYNPDADLYMFVWVVPAGGSGGTGPARLVAQKEVWYDRQTKLPRQVMLFDANGRVLLRALLSKHKSVEENGPKVATEYSLLFPDTGSTMSIVLTEMKFEKNHVPTRHGIAFPGPNPADAGVKEVIQLDKDCKE